MSVCMSDLAFLAVILSYFKKVIKPRTKIWGCRIPTYPHHPCKIQVPLIYRSKKKITVDRILAGKTLEMWKCMTHLFWVKKPPTIPPLTPNPVCPVNWKPKTKIPVSTQYTCSLARWEVSTHMGIMNSLEWLENPLCSSSSRNPQAPGKNCKQK